MFVCNRPCQHTTHVQLRRPSESCWCFCWYAQFEVVQSHMLLRLWTCDQVYLRSLLPPRYVESAFLLVAGKTVGGFRGVSLCSALADCWQLCDSSCKASLQGFSPSLSGRMHRFQICCNGAYRKRYVCICQGGKDVRQWCGTCCIWDLMDINPSWRLWSTRSSLLAHTWKFLVVFWSLSSGGRRYNFYCRGIPSSWDTK